MFWDCSVDVYFSRSALFGKFGFFFCKFCLLSLILMVFSLISLSSLILQWMKNINPQEWFPISSNLLSFSVFHVLFSLALLSQNVSVAHFFTGRVLSLIWICNSVSWIVYFVLNFASKFSVGSSNWAPVDNPVSLVGVYSGLLQSTARNGVRNFLSVFIIVSLFRRCNRLSGIFFQHFTSFQLKFRSIFVFGSVSFLWFVFRSVDLDWYLSIWYLSWNILYFLSL